MVVDSVDEDVKTSEVTACVAAADTVKRLEVVLLVVTVVLLVVTVVDDDSVNAVMVISDVLAEVGGSAVLMLKYALATLAPARVPWFEELPLKIQKKKTLESSRLKSKRETVQLKDLVDWEALTPSGVGSSQ